MKTLSFNELAQINGGWRDAVDGFCTGVAIYSLFGPVGWALGGGCTAYGVFRYFES